MADDLLPSFPVDGVTLDAIEHALGGAWSVDGEGTHTLIGADYSLHQLLDFMAGISRAEDPEHLTQIDDNVFVDDRIHYTEHDIIRALIAEVRKLRTLCRRAADSSAGYALIGGVYAELREEGERG